MINSYDELHDQYEKLNSELAEKDLSCPEHWEEWKSSLLELSFGTGIKIDFTDEKFTNYLMESRKSVYSVPKLQKPKDIRIVFF